jgi:putative tricarboxylic transport membrane protein
MRWPPTTRQMEVIIGVAFIGLALVVVRESLLLGAGWASIGPQPGMFPFISAAVMGLCGLGVCVQALNHGGGGRPFADPSEFREVLRVAAPMVLAVVLLPYLGFYLVTALYIGLFAAWYGRMRWYLVLPLGILIAVVAFYAFEQGFKVLLPKSILYGYILPF